MFNDRKILAIIPARGGSKGVPGKNIKELAGKPLITWSIAAGRHSKYVDRLVVSTDCPEIAEVACHWGGEVPFLRPSELATDEAKGIDAVLHAIRWFREIGECFDFVLVLQPTSPLRTSEDIDNAIELLFQKSANAIVSVCHTEHHPWWSNTLPEDGSMQNFLRPEVQNSNRQDLPKFYRLNGAIYLADIAFLERARTFISEGTYAYPMTIENSVDIDALLDFRLAGCLLAERERHR